MFRQMTTYGRFAFGLRRFLGEPATAERGRALIQQRLRDRNSDFLALVKGAVYSSGRGPYVPLLRMAGCEYADLERMVRSHGIEPTLERLRAEGVYITIDEFKCRYPIVRGTTTVECTPNDFDNPFLTAGLQASSSGSRSPGTVTTLSLERVGYVAFCQAVAYSAHGLLGRPVLLWMPTLPSAAGMVLLLELSKMGVPPVRWFSPVASSAIRPALSKRLATLYVVHAGRLLGASIPAPEYVGGDQVHVVLASLRQILEAGHGCVVHCSPSSAARLAHEARTEGVTLTDVTFVTGGEPLTPAKAAEIGAVGAHAVGLYASTEVGTIGFGCAGSATACDDIHVLESSHAVIQYERSTPFGGGPVQSLLFTSFHDRAAKILLNVESGDYGVLESRECGCEFGSLGLKRHLHSIRSFDKLTGEGMTFVGTDLVRIIEEVLPQQFGGTSIDYQLVETEGVGGRTRLDVLVSPDVGTVDEDAVVRQVLQQLARGSDTNRMMAEMWREKDVLRVKRERPHLTAGGKLLPLHIMKTPRV